MKSDTQSFQTSSAGNTGPAEEEITLHGIPASPGIAIGVVLLVDGREKPIVSSSERPIDDEEVPSECRRFESALEQTRKEIIALKENVELSLSGNEAGIFDAHLLIVDDKMLRDEVLNSIRTKHLSAESVFSGIIQRYIQAISGVNDLYLKERAADVSDVATRILGHLSGTGRTMLEHLPGMRIIVSRELAPSDTAMLDRENVQAFATETGSRTSHTAILSRSMKIPSVLGVPGLLSIVRTGQTAIIDGFLGDIILNPTEKTLLDYAKKEEEEQRLYNELLQERNLTPETLDGYRISLFANLDEASDAPGLCEYGVSGIGLFRTEYLFMGSRLPTEEEQFQVYKQVTESLQNRPVTIRTLDLGGDKLSSLIELKNEPNPFLGLRSVRLCLAYPELIVPQLRALLRASAFGKLRIMFPMITTSGELDKMLELFGNVKNDLRKQKIRFDDQIPVGAMIETPSAALSAEVLAEKADFFSIGTNDLVQYTMAVDRGNEKVANLYQPLHPVILRLIARTLQAGRKAGIPVSICGEMASSPKAIPILAGLGIQNLSMTTGALGMAKRLIRRLRLSEAEQLAGEVLDCTTEKEVTEKTENLLRKILPDALKLEH